MRGNGVGRLGQTKPYSIFLLNFVRCFLSAKTFDMEHKTESFSQMMRSMCEAFAVIDYANKYVTWRNECRQEMGEEVSSLTDRVNGLTWSIKPYTGDAVAQGKHKGWSGEGLELNHRIVELLDEQRKSEKHGVMFKGQLKKKVEGEGGPEEAVALMMMLTNQYLYDI